MTGEERKGVTDSEKDKTGGEASGKQSGPERENGFGCKSESVSGKGRGLSTRRRDKACVGALL